MPAIWRDALELSGARSALPPPSFTLKANELRRQLPLAATVIGLKHGDPGAMRLLTLAAALAPGTLDAALQASRNQRLNERMAAERTGHDDDVTVDRTVTVALNHAAAVDEAGAAPSVSEARCAERQLRAWRSLQS